MHNPPLQTSCSRVVRLLPPRNLHWPLLTLSPWFTLEFTFGVVPSIGFDNVSTIIVSYRIISLPSTFSVLCLFILSCPLVPGNHCFFFSYCLHSFAFSRISYIIVENIQYVLFHIAFFHLLFAFKFPLCVFHGMIAHFYLVRNNFPLFGFLF